MEPWLATAASDPRKPHASAPQPGRHPVGGCVHVALLRLRGAAESGQLYDAMRAPEPNERQQHLLRAWVIEATERHGLLAWTEQAYSLADARAGGRDQRPRLLGAHPQPQHGRETAGACAAQLSAVAVPTGRGSSSSMSAAGTPITAAARARTQRAASATRSQVATSTSSSRPQ